MNRILLGAAIGAAVVYFFDVERGEIRRNRATDWGRQYINSDTMTQAKQATQATVRQAKSLTGQMTDQVSQLRSGRRSSNTSTSLNSLQPDSVPQI